MEFTKNKNNNNKKDVGLLDQNEGEAESCASARQSEKTSGRHSACTEESLSDADSMASAGSMAMELVPARFWRDGPSKRPYEEEVPASDDEVTPANTTSIMVVPTAKRGRGRPPTSGKYVGLAKAQAELNALRRQEEQDRVEKEVAAKVASHKATRVVAPPAPKENNGGLASDLVQQVGEATEVILKVAMKSGNLKGTFVKALKEAAASIKAAVEELSSTTVSEETAKLQADNVRLRAELAELRKEIGELRAKVHQIPERMDEAPLPSDSVKQQEELARSIMLQVGSMINARLEGMEERLLPAKRIRPPLAADKRQEATPKPMSTKKTVPEKSRPNGAKEKAPEPKGRGKTGKTPASNISAKNQDAQKRQPVEVLPAPEDVDQGWSTVTRRKQTKKTKTKTTPSNGQKAEKAKQTAWNLRPPRSAAIVITLQPGAEESGVSYAKVLADAKSKIDLASCGISSLRFRKAVTGARILEVSAGEASAEKADSLAQKLKETLSADVARVSRPTKCAEFKITGLDDSVSKEDIIDVVAQRGECPKENIKVIGDIKRSYQGTGVAVVSCPVVAVKKIRDEGRLLVGWVSARVEMLQARPMRCYRCLQKGHTRSTCSAEVDRSEECYRCGHSGHKSATCSAPPKCSLCAAANKPAAHWLGSSKCAPPKPGRKPANKSGTTSATTSCPPPQAGEKEAMMETNN